MQYISFYKDHLPFKPKSNVVIYFDVTGIGMKLYYGIIDEYYDRIVEEFSRGGLEFCFLPKIAHDMDLEKIYHYFNPQASPDEYIPYVNLYQDRDLLEYIVADYDPWRWSPALIQYMGEDFDKEESYTFSYTPIPEVFNSSPIPLIQQYVEMHGIYDAVFGASPVEASLPCIRSYDKYPNDVSVGVEVELMMSEVQMLVERLRQSGVGEIALQRLFKPTQKLSRMHIQCGRIFLPIITIWRLRCLHCQRPFTCFTCAILKVSCSRTCRTIVMSFFIFMG